MLGLGIILVLVGAFLVYGSSYDSLVNFLVSSFRLRPIETGIQVCMGGALCPNPGLTVRLALFWSGFALLLVGIFFLGFGAVRRASQTKALESLTRSEMS